MADRIIVLAATVLATAAAWAFLVGAAGLVHDLTGAGSGWPAGVCDTHACWHG